MSTTPPSLGQPEAEDPTGTQQVDGEVGDQVAVPVDGQADGQPIESQPTIGMEDADVRLILDLGSRDATVPPQLDDDQRQVVAHRGSPLLVLAGPGTGKTTTLVEAMAARLVGEDALEPAQVLGLTFSRAAAADWRDRLIARIGGGVTPTVSTFHSFAFSLVRRFPHLLGLMAAPRLLAGHEEEAAVRDVLRSLAAANPTDWPAHVRAAAPTLEFARQIRAAVARARSFEKSPAELRSYAQDSGKPEWLVVADVLQAYEFWLESADAFDYAGLISAATNLVAIPEVAEQLHNQLRAVFVDEFQDTDAAQVRLLRAICGPCCDVVVVGDPDQSIYAFRGAQVRGILDFGDDFATREVPVSVVALRTCRRFGASIRAAADIEISKVDYAGSSAWARARAAHREPLCDGYAEGAVNVFLAADERSEAAAIAERIRELRHAGAAYSDIAVLARTVDQLVPLRRGLTAAGIPVAVLGDHTPIRHEQAVTPLLNALLLVESPSTISSEVARELLLSPLCGIDPIDLRRTVRNLRTALAGTDASARPSTPDVLKALVTDSSTLVSIKPDNASSAALVALRAFHKVIDAAREALHGGGSVEQVLWQLWDGGGRRSSWSQRLRRQALRGGAAGRRADRDIDSVMTLFEMASRASHTMGKTCGLFVREVRRQSAPVADTTVATPEPAVAMMTAHRAKGLEWDHVFIAGVQEGLWPNTVSRAGVVTADDLNADGLTGGPTSAELLAEERRLFYVCMTRARRSVTVSALQIADNSQSAERPSRFVMALAASQHEGSPVDSNHALDSPESESALHLPVLRARGATRGSMPALVAHLRQVLDDDAATPGLKSAAAIRLRRLQTDVPASAGLVHPANPQSWWGSRAPSEGITPVRPDGPLRFSPTAVELLDQCALRWFLERQMSAQTLTATAATFGSIIHAVGEFIVSSSTPLTLEQVQAHIDRIWHHVGFQAAWIGDRQRQEMTRAVERFLAWHNDRVAAGSNVRDVEFKIHAEVTITGADGAPQVVSVSGRADRLEVVVDDDGEHAQVYDIKSYGRAPTKNEVGANIQLALYALAVDQQATAEGNPYASVDAGLVMVKIPAGDRLPKVMTMSDHAVAGFDVRDVVAEAAIAVRQEVFPAVAGKTCRFCQMKVVCPLYMPKDAVVGDGEEVSDDAE